MLCRPLVKETEELIAVITAILVNCKRSKSH